MDAKGKLNLLRGSARNTLQLPLGLFQSSCKAFMTVFGLNAEPEEAESLPPPRAPAVVPDRGAAMELERALELQPWTRTESAEELPEQWRHGQSWGTRFHPEEIALNARQVDARPSQDGCYVSMPQHMPAELLERTLYLETRPCKMTV